MILQYLEWTFYKKNMKKTVLLFIIFLIAIGSIMSQSNLIFFSEVAYPFSVIINGVKQNQNPQTNIFVESLTAPSYKVKIIFEDKTIPSINKNIYTKDGMEVTYIIKKNKKGENVLRYYTENIASYDPIEIVHPEENEDVILIIDEASYDNNSGGINIDIDISNNDGGININTPDVEINTQYDETIIEENIEIPPNEMPDYNETVGCNWTMNDADFQKAENTIKKVDFSSDKLIIAKQIIDANCITSQQVKKLISLFEFENEKLEFAKYAYTHTFDIENYYIVNDVFDFSSSIKELDEYIKSIR